MIAKPRTAGWVGKAVLAAGLLPALLAGGCGMKDERSAGNEGPRPERDVNQVLEENRERILGLPGVQGVYVSALEDGSPCIKVAVSEFTPELEESLPTRLEGHPVVVVETGPIEPRGGEGG
jgi:hypothetical protein